MNDQYGLEEGWREFWHSGDPAAYLRYIRLKGLQKMGESKACNRTY